MKRENKIKSTVNDLDRKDKVKKDIKRNIQVSSTYECFS